MDSLICISEALVCSQFCTAMAIWEQNAVTKDTSSSVNTAPFFLLMSWMTPTTSSSLSSSLLMGMHRMVFVLYPVLISIAGLNRGSWYASSMFNISPVVATWPHIPAPRGIRIVLAPFATLEYNSSVWVSTKNRVARSESLKAHASLITDSKSWSSSNLPEIRFVIAKSWCVRTDCLRCLLMACSSFSSLLWSACICIFAEVMSWFDWTICFLDNSNWSVFSSVADNWTDRLFISSSSWSVNFLLSPTLFTSCKTAIVSPELAITGMASICFVRYPEDWSKLESNRLSLYASSMFNTSPVFATYPHIPLCKETRISLPISVMRENSSSFSLSTTNKVARSAFAICFA